MNVFLTFDYEIFFGSSSGSVEKCMIEPTDQLLALAEKHKIKYTFFWDIGHYLALKRMSDGIPTLKLDQQKIEKQLKNVLQLGHSLQLHVHPHWEKANFTDGKWQMNLENHYKLSDFEAFEHRAIFKKYKEALDDFVGEKGKAFRAGGWCIQPFSIFKPLFLENGIQIDSSTMPGVKWESEQYQIDFTTLKTAEPFRFSNNPCEEDKSGEFIQYPIATKFYSPWFFWKLYVLGRLFPQEHKMWGNGNFVSQPGGKKESLLKGKNHHASSDGYFATQLQSILNENSKKNATTLVVIGHPKSVTKFSLKKLTQFVKKNKTKHSFISFQNQDEIR